MSRSFLELIKLLLLIHIGLLDRGSHCYSHSLRLKILQLHHGCSRIDRQWLKFNWCLASRGNPHAHSWCHVDIVGNLLIIIFVSEHSVLRNCHIIGLVYELSQHCKLLTSQVLDKLVHASWVMRYQIFQHLDVQLLFLYELAILMFTLFDLKLPLHEWQLLDSFPPKFYLYLSFLAICWLWCRLWLFWDLRDLLKRLPIDRQELLLFFAWISASFPTECWFKSSARKLVIVIVRVSRFRWRLCFFDSLD